MIRFATGNLLESCAEALVNTVNTVGVMGKGIALMFKDAYPANFAAYKAACDAGEIDVGRIFVTTPQRLDAPRWIVNFPTKRHWRQPSRIEWIEAGLADLRAWIEREGVGSIAIPPLGAGNGGLDWLDVRPLVERALDGLAATEVTVFEPSRQYWAVAKSSGNERLTPARAAMIEAIRRYCSLGTDCSLLEAQKLAWFVDRSALDLGHPPPLRLDFQPHRYGPYSHPLQKMLDGLDGSFLHCERRIGDASPTDAIWCDESRRDLVATYMEAGEGKVAKPALDRAKAVIEGFETPFGMELLATVDWLRRRQGVAEEVAPMRAGLGAWPGGPGAAQRKLRIFDDRVVDIALRRLVERAPLATPSQPPHTASDR